MLTDVAKAMRLSSFSLTNPMASDPKELLIVPNADHVDLYDKMEKIPFDKVTDFFGKNLK